MLKALVDFLTNIDAHFLIEDISVGLQKKIDNELLSDLEKTAV